MAVDQALVVKLYRDGWKQAEISKKLGIHKSYVHLVLRNHGVKPFPPTRINTKLIQKIKNEYQSGLSIQELIDKYKITRYDVTVVLKKKFRHPGDSNHAKAMRNSSFIDEHQKQLLLGTLLGDGSISKSKHRSYKVSVGHSEKQKGYVEYKAKMMGCNIHKLVNHGFSNLPFWRFVYQNVRVSEYLKGIVLINEKKTVNQRWMDELTLEGVAYWFMDDGSSSFNKSKKNIVVHFSTESYSYEEQILLINKLAKFGFKTSINNIKSRKEGTNMFLSMSQIDTIKFMKSIKKYVWPIKCMRYKIKIP